MELKDIIKDIKKRYNLTNAELAQKLNVSPNTVSRWLIGQVKSIQGETASALNELLGYDVQGVLQGNLVNLKKPILGMVKAGYDMFIDQDYLGEEIVSSDEYTSGDYFLRVSGDSMNQSGIVDGGLVYVKSTNIVNNGDIAVFCIDDVLYANYLLNNFKINEEKYMDDFKIFSIKKIYLNTYSRCERDIIRIIEDIYHIEL